MSDQSHDEVRHDAEPGFVSYYYIVLGISWAYLLFTFFSGGGHH